MGKMYVHEGVREGAHLSEMLTQAALAGLAHVPLKLQILHQGQLLRELQANASAQVREGLHLVATSSDLLLLPTTFCSAHRSQVLLRCCPALQTKRWTGWCWGSCRWS